MQRLLIGILLVIPALSIGAENRGINFGGSSGLTVLSQEVSRTVLRLELGEVSLEASSGTEEVKLSLPESFGLKRGEVLASTGEVLPTLTLMLSIPFDSPAPTIRVLSEAWQSLEEVSLLPPSVEVLEGHQGEIQPLGAASSFLWGEEAGIMRDLRLYSLTLRPFTYDSPSQTLEVLRHLELEVLHPGSRITREEGLLSEAFVPIYRALVDNPQVFDPISPTRGAYWIIYPDAFAANIVPLADWKKAKGFAVETISKTQIGSNNYTVIRSYILARFDSCLIKPDYIVIVGDVLMPNSNGIVTRQYSNSYGDGDSDNYYSFLYGNDYFPDLLIGRISIDNVSELSAYLNKLFIYERTPYMTDTGWYQRGTVVAGSDGGSFVSPRLVKLWCREIMMDSGFTQVDTFFSDWSGIPPSQINASINNGVSFVNYRGYGYADMWTPPDYTVYNINQLTNNNRFPIMTSMVCATGDFNDATDICFGEAWIRGANKGGAGFIGNTNHYGHTVWTNAIDVGVYWGWFADGVVTLAQGELMGKMNLYNAFPYNRETGGQVDLYFNTYNDLGDPEVNIWTTIPRAMGVFFQDSLAIGENHIAAQVQGPGGEPLEGAVICLWKGSEVFASGFAGPNGNHDFLVNPQTEGPMRLTATHRNHIPVEDTIHVVSAPMAVSYQSHIIDDDAAGESSGDGDGILNPSETIELGLWLKNFGLSDTARGLSCSLSADTTSIRILRGTATFTDLVPGDSAYSGLPYLIQVKPDAFDQTTIPLVLNISDNAAHAWQGTLSLRISASSLIVSNVQVIEPGGNGLIDPGETVEFVITAQNVGSKQIQGASASLRTADNQIEILDSLAVFGDCAPGATFDNSIDHFTILIDIETFVGHVINFELEFAGSGPQNVSTSFNRQVGQVGLRDPIGPDSYGYYCFDDGDTAYADHPTYNWIDISTSWPYVSLLDDAMATVALPFTVQYYGQDFDHIAISDNGFISLGGNTWYGVFYNTPIPAPQNPKALVAPFWDDFVQNPLRVYYNHDSVNGRFIIGWRNAMNDESYQTQTFEIILLDTALWPTITGDNEIIFQYNLVRSPIYNSIGICSPDRRDGIQYMFNGNYTLGAPNLVAGRAIKFTTGAGAPGCDYILGDINNSGVSNGIDVIYGVNYFKGGAAPPYSCDCPNHGALFAACDVNGTCSFNGIDLTYMVNYFKGGPNLIPCQDCPPPARFQAPVDEGPVGAALRKMQAPMPAE